MNKKKKSEIKESLSAIDILTVIPIKISYIILSFNK